jgi:hypothetical protein
MTFWKYLRWISSIAFVALVIAVWLSGGQPTGSGGNGTQPLPPAPIIVR